MHLVLKFWLWGRFVAEKQTFVLNLMAGHLLNMTYNENGKWNVWELDHYIDRSSLGIHFWDLYWKMAYLKFEKFWYANVRPWETVQIWGDCPSSANFCGTLEGLYFFRAGQDTRWGRPFFPVLVLYILKSSQLAIRSRCHKYLTHYWSRNIFPRSCIMYYIT